MANVLGRIRLSRVSDTTTSPERQRKDITRWADAHGHTVVGWAEDLGVSRAVNPLEAPDLVPWLAPDQVGTWEILAGAKLDRIATGSVNLNRVMDWCEKHGKTLVSVSESFDLSTWQGQMMANIIAGMAQGELEAIRERQASAFQHNIREGKWRGGVPPWGYLPEKDVTTGEWRLFQDPEQVKTIMEVVDRVLSGEPLRSVARDLTERKIPTPKDRFAQHQNREVKGYEWHSGPLRRSLLSKTLLGYAMTRSSIMDAQGRPVRDANGKKQYGDDIVVTTDDGSPVIRSKPILTREVFARLGAELESRENRKEPTSRTSGMLLRIAYCGVCGQPAYKFGGSNGRTFRLRCASVQKHAPCGNKTIPMPVADSMVEEAILGLLGESERMVREWSAGSDNSVELEDINGRLIDLTEQLTSGLFPPGTPQRQKLNENMQSLVARQASLSTEKVTPSGWTWVPTGVLFRDWWNAQDAVSRNVWLRSMGVRFDFVCSARGNKTGVDSVNLDLGDLETLAKELKPQGAAVEWQGVFKEMTNSNVRNIEITDTTLRAHMADGSIIEVDK